MKIILNHTLRSMRAHIGQSIIIIFTVAVVSILIFASLSLGDLFYNFQFANLSRLSGSTDVSISGDLFSDTRFKEFTDSHSDEIEYIDKYLTTPGLLNNAGQDNDIASAVLIEATDIKTFLSRYKDKLVYLDGINADTDYVYPGIFISKSFSNKYGYNIGDEVSIYLGLNQKYENFTVTYIFEDEGVFANTVIYNIITDITSLGDKGLYNVAYIKLKNTADVNNFMDELTRHMDNPNLEVDYAVDYEYIENLVANNESLLRIALIFIIALVIFILFGAYLIVAKNRAGELVVFKAAGATPVQIFNMLLFEGIFYGLIGSIIGVICGRFVMQIVVMNVIPNFPDAVVYTVWNYVVSICLGICISILSALIPIIRLVKSSVHNLNSSGVKMVKKFNPLWILIPLVISIASIIMIIYFTEYSLIFTILLIVSVVAVVVLATPYVIAGVSKLFAINEKSVNVASFTIKRNSEAVSLSGMLGAIIVFAFISVSIVNIIIEASIPYNTRFDADYVVESISTNINMDSLNAKLESVYGITESHYLNYEEFEWKFGDRETTYIVYSVKSSQDLRCTMELSDKEKEDFDNIDNAAIFSYDMLNRLNLKIGDEVTFTIDDKDYKFKIVATDNNITNTDRILYIKDSAIDRKLKESIIFLKTSKDIPNISLYYEIREIVEEKGCYVIKHDDWVYATSVGVIGISSLLRILEIAIIFVGFVGIINMTMSMFLSRKREFQIYRAVGIDEKRYFKLLTFESFIISITGGIIGLICSFAVNFIVPNFAVLIDRYIDATYFPLEVLFIIGIVIILYWLVYVMVGKRQKIKQMNIERNIM